MHINDLVWRKDQLAWFKIADGLPRFDTNSSAVATKAHGKTRNTDLLLVGNPAHREADVKTAIAPTSA
ncbi:MAG: hypothetical protein ABI821_01080 [Pseudomonadota bacterium]